MWREVLENGFCERLRRLAGAHRSGDVSKRAWVFSRHRNRLPDPKRMAAQRTADRLRRLALIALKRSPEFLFGERECIVGG